MGLARGYDKVTGSKCCKGREDLGSRRRKQAEQFLAQSPGDAHLSHSAGAGRLAECLHLGNIKEVKTGIANQTPGKCLNLHEVEN